MDPYISLVVTARNDNHGGDLLGRMQAFVNNWLNQSRLFQIPSELIVVEWNPPADRPRLAEALRWPSEPGPCTVRIIEVSPELHAELGPRAVLPLYQMIAKNVGIRRARGEFVLATNIDILFSSELAGFLSRRQLDPGRMYRIDRHDAQSGVPVDAGPDAQIAYCRERLIRVNRREGTFPVDDGAQTPPQEQAKARRRVHPWPGIAFGNGWFPEERHGEQEVFRWAGGQADVLVKSPAARGATLRLEIEPGPGARGPLDLSVAVEGRPAGRFLLTRRCLLDLRADWKSGAHIRFSTNTALSATPHDARSISFRVIRSAWKSSWRRVPAAPSGVVRRLPLSRRARVVGEGVRHIFRKLANEGPLVHLTVFVSPSMQKLLRSWAPAESGDGQQAVIEPRKPAGEPAFIHTNACGDFTLLAREKWFDLRAYPEFVAYSMNLDSIFCFAAHHGGAPEEVLADPMRIYHIEHGSGWTPEAQAKLYARIEALGASWVDNDTVMSWAREMRRFESPMIFNGDNWGFAGFDLPETTPVRGE
jgi:hypothetical protein